MSTINLSFKKKSLIEFVIEVDDSIEVEKNYFGLRLEPFQYGNDQDIDTVIYPGSVTLEFTILPKQIDEGIPNPFGDPTPYGEFGTPLAEDIDDEYFKLSDSLCFNDAEVTVTKDGTEYLVGYINKNNVGNDYGKRSITITVLSNFGKLKDLDPRSLDPDDFRTAPLDVSPGGQVLFTDVILGLLQIVYPTIDQVVLMSDIRSMTTYTLLGVPQSVGVQYFGTFNYIYIGPNARYSKASDVIKEICSLFGCVGIVMGTKFIMQSRFYYSQTTVTLLKDYYLKGKGPTILTSQKLNGMQVIVGESQDQFYLYEELYGQIGKRIDYDGGSGNFQVGESVSWENGSAIITKLATAGSAGTMELLFSGLNTSPGNNDLLTGAISGATANVNGTHQDLLNDEFVETIRISNIGGDPPGIDGTTYPLLVRNIWIYIPAFITGLGYDTWVTSVRNSFFVTGGTQKPLWKCVADEIWPLISSDRMVYVQEVPGVDWEYNKYYRFDTNAFRFRPRKIYFDEMNGTTKLELIKG